VDHFSERLRYVRKLRKLSQKALAKACGLSQSAISNYESEARKQAKNVFPLAEALQVSADWLANGIGPMETPHTPVHIVSQPGAHATEAHWPFPRITPSDYWLLSAQDRRLVEDTVCSLILSLRERSLQR